MIVALVVTTSDRWMARPGYQDWVIVGSLVDILLVMCTTKTHNCSSGGDNLRQMDGETRLLGLGDCGLSGGHITGNEHNQDTRL